MKHCAKCGKFKFLSEFYLRKNEGYYCSPCKECQKESSLKWWTKNKTRALERRRKWSKKTNYDSNYYSINKERINYTNNQWYLKNKSKKMSKSKIWRKNNRTRYLLSNNKRFSKNCKTLSDDYVKLSIRGRSKLSFKCIPNSLIEAKRQQLKLRRLCYEQN